MTPRATTTRHHRSSHPIEAVAHQLHSWKPFYQHLTDPSNSNSNSKPYLFPTKRPCRSDRSTAPPLPPDLDLSRLALRDRDRDNPDLDLDATATATARSHRDHPPPLDGYKRWIARKRRRRGSRSVSLSGRSSCGDRSTTHLTLTCTAATCSDSSGELMSWGSDVSEVRIIIPKPKHNRQGRDSSALSFAPHTVTVTDKEGAASASALAAPPGQEKDPLHLQGNDSGYGSEPGYRGDAELGYGDEFDEDDEFDARHLLFWGDHRIKADGYQRAIEGDNKTGELKSHHRNRRKKIIM